MSRQTHWARKQEGLLHGYEPPDELVVDPGLAFHDDAVPDVDPITFGVIRSRLWHINWDHQETIRRISGSGIVVYGYDFNTSIQTELGEGVVFGPGNIFFAGCADLAVKWTLEYRSGNVGIREGDIFIHDDPWIGTNHQMDTAVFAPVHVDGRLFCWVFNVVHQREIGGAEPGGSVQTARDVHSEPTFWPPTKIVEGGVLREDIAEAWTRRSRLPELIHLELKSQIAGINFTTRRMHQLVGKYGAQTVKGVMHGMIRQTEDVVRRRLRTLPDGTWRDVRYAAGSSPEDRHVHRYEIRVTKVDGHLYVTNEGTDPSTGSFNITFGQWRACVLSSALILLAYDQQLCGAGMLRCMTFDHVRDAMTSASHPAGVSAAGSTMVSVYQSFGAFCQMLSGSPELRHDVLATSGIHTPVVPHVFGTDRSGRPYANFPFDGVVGGLGAFAWRDGFDHGGAVSSTVTPVGSVESWEREIPFLYLYRRQLRGSGGHGRWRGGDTFVSGWVGHDTDASYISSGGLLQSVTLGIGLVGGFPSSGGTMWLAHDTVIQAELAAGRLPGSPEELRALAPDGAPPPPKKFDNRLLPGDLFELMPGPGAGYGDPLLRAPALVAADRREEKLTEDQVADIYGVVLDADGEPMLDATATLRRQVRERRIAAAEPPRATLDVAGPFARVVRMIETVALVRDPDGRDYLACADCDRLLGDAAGSFEDGCGVLHVPLPSLGPRTFLDPATQVDDPVVVRVYLCPGCGGALRTVVCLETDPREAHVTALAPSTERLENDGVR